MKVDINKYPTNLPWEMKAFSMPNIPRGEAGMLDSLRTILELVRNNSTTSEQLNIKGSDSKIDLGTACIRLRPMKLVIKTPNGWILSDEANTWLDTNDNLYLAAFLCARIKFLAEILYYLDSPKTAAELQDIAINDYSLSWKTKSDINARLVWLRQLGLVEFQEFSLLYLLTPLGQEFAKTIYIEEPVKLDFSFDDTINEKELEISDWVISKCSSIPLQRKGNIGYILGDVKQFQETIFDFIQLIDGGQEYQKIQHYAIENYDIAASSLRSFLTTLSNLGIIERKTNTIYDITAEARNLVEKNNIIDLICLMHCQFGFMIELLSVLKNRNMSYKELAATAKVSYGFDRENIEEIRKRISIFKTAKLVRNATTDTYTITNRANLLLKVISIEPLTNISVALEDPVVESEDSEFFTNLRLATKDSSNFEKLEELVEIAFKKLGFETQRLGGSGKTDVLIRAAGTASSSYTVAVDAKSTMTGVVNDGLIDFDTIEEHKKKHNAIFSAIVGGSFQNERLIRRAIEHGVVLFDVETLENLIKEHLEIPIKVTSYKKIFEQPGLADINCLHKEREQIKRYGELLYDVMDCLIAVQDDPVYKGVLQDRDIYGFLRTRNSFGFSLGIEEISNMLNFLSSPLIGCVEKTKDGYCAVGTLTDASQKFEFFSRMCAESK